mmetsp:Transcript_41646/g.81889  ORF Transcript_41646/g.81889 Transcript_41646/m.81889 type:complete len:253 (-) Transcript_41646:1527-2285(-)
MIFACFRLRTARVLSVALAEVVRRELSPRASNALPVRKRTLKASRAASPTSLRSSPSSTHNASTSDARGSGAKEKLRRKATTPAKKAASSRTFQRELRARPTKSEENEEHDEDGDPVPSDAPSTACERKRSDPFTMSECSRLLSPTPAKTCGRRAAQCSWPLCPKSPASASDTIQNKTVSRRFRLSFTTASSSSSPLPPPSALLTTLVERDACAATTMSALSPMLSSLLAAAGSSLLRMWARKCARTALTLA